MGKCRFKEGTVRHDGAGKVRQVLLSEVGKRQFTELFRQCQSAGSGFHIGGKEGGIVLPVGNDEHQCQRKQAAHNVKDSSFVCNFSL